jgi:LuxR family maltose regulon positive regulatory protein
VRLAEPLDRAATAKLMLVSAPAGFGKTTLLAQWLERWLGSGSVRSTGVRAAAWLSLDPDDNDPATFWTYVVSAVRSAVPSVGESALAVLQDPRPPPIQLVLTTLLNDLGAFEGELVLVLDDYHVIDSLEVQEAMRFLVAHLPPQLHVVIASRTDPALPLAGMRGRGELVEVRAAELRFTIDEAAAYLNEMMGLRLTVSDVAALEERTEGWVAALQLAALSMQGREDVTGFIAGFAGDDRYVVDYLVEEVLQRQPEQVQAFLLRTSVLGRLSGPLCDAVTGQSDGRATLEALDRANLFLVPLDGRRHWYRYHHLFADVLQARLLGEQLELVPDLHRRASQWWEHNGEPAEAVRHALAGKDFERAARLVEVVMPVLLRDRREATLRSWLEVLPDELVRARPWLGIGLAGALLSTGEVEGVEQHLRDVERWLDTAVSDPSSTTGDTPSTDVQQRRRLTGWVAVYRAGLALVLGDAAVTVTQARRALALLDEDDHLGRGAAEALIGLASWGAGDLDAAHDGYAASLARMQRAGHIADVLGCTVVLADILTVQGRLHDAMSCCERALRLAARPAGSPALRGAPDAHVAIAMLHHQLGHDVIVAEHLRRSQELGEHLGLPRYPYRWRVAMSRVHEAEGDVAAALSLLDEAERLYVGDFSPDVQPVAAMRTRMLLRQGTLSPALAWARDRGLSSEDDLSYLHEFEHITLARVLLAQHQHQQLQRGQRPDRLLQEARALLERLHQAAEAGGRRGSLIEILVLQALAHHLRGDVPSALGALQRALELGEPQGYVRVFVDEGPPMAALLRAVAQEGARRGGHRDAGDYARRLLTAFGTPIDTAEAATASRVGHPADMWASPDSARVSGAARMPVEPLSERETEVLRLLASDLSGPEIARELVVSPNTIRTHTRSIYAKLDVNSRRAAVRRAAELGLLSRSDNRGRSQSR